MKINDNWAGSAGGRRGRHSRTPSAALIAVSCAILTVTYLLPGGGAQTADGQPGDGQAPLVIGAVFAQTGLASSEGPQQAKGTQLAVSQINAAGGIDGVPLRVIVRDNHSGPTEAGVLARQLIGQDHVLALLGPTTSDSAVIMDPIADRARVPVIAVSNVVDGIVGHCPYPCSWVWRVSLGDQTAVADTVAYTVQSLHREAAAIVYSTPDVLGRQDAVFAASAFKSLSVPIVAVGSAAESSSNVGPLVRSVLAHHPDALFVGSASAGFVSLVIHAAHAAGFSGSVLGGNTLNSSTIAAELGPEGAGALSGAAWTRHVQFPANAAFIQSYENTYGGLPDQFAAQAFTGVEVLAQAMQRAKPSLGPQSSLAARRSAIQDALSSTALSTPLGPFRFTADHDVDQIVWVVEVNAEGSHSLVDFCEATC